MRDTGLICVSALLLVGLGTVVPTVATGQPVGDHAPFTADTVAAVLDEYCVTCHSARVVTGEGAAPSPLVAQLRAAGLALDTLDVSDVASEAAAWEAVAQPPTVYCQPHHQRAIRR